MLGSCIFPRPLHLVGALSSLLSRSRSPSRSWSSSWSWSWSRRPLPLHHCIRNCRQYSAKNPFNNDYNNNNNDHLDATKGCMPDTNTTATTSTNTNTNINPLTMDNAKLQENKRQLTQFFIKEARENGDTSFGVWDKLYQAELTPWNAGKPAPALIDALEAGHVPPGRVLVPGCGQGYDVFAMASKDRWVLGLDISPRVIAECEQMKRERGGKDWDAHANFVIDDFFESDISQLLAKCGGGDDAATSSSQRSATTPAVGFDAVYDYTFFCAIPPEWRARWGKRMGQLIRPGGTLLTLIFPLGDHKEGPPFAVQVDAYENVLKNEGFETPPHLIPVTRSFPERQGKEIMGIWKKKT